jgi:hypothetical protein
VTNALAYNGAVSLWQAPKYHTRTEMTNALAYNSPNSAAAKKSFVVQAPETGGGGVVRVVKFVRGALASLQLQVTLILRAGPKNQKKNLFSLERCPFWENFFCTLLHVLA